jgi:hypothetical protein
MFRVRLVFLFLGGCVVSSCWHGPDKRLLEALEEEENRLWSDIDRLNKEEAQWFRCGQDPRVSEERAMVCHTKFIEAMAREKAEQEMWNRLLEIHSRFERPAKQPR